MVEGEGDREGQEKESKNKKETPTQGKEGGRGRPKFLKTPKSMYVRGERPDEMIPELRWREELSLLLSCLQCSLRKNVQHRRKLLEGGKVGSSARLTRSEFIEAASFM